MHHASQECEKKRKYERRIIEVEKASFSPLVFSTSGGQAPECTRFHKRLAELLAAKRGHSYGDTIRIIRQKLRFCILRTTLTAIRGYWPQKEKKDDLISPITEIDFDLETGIQLHV